MFIHIQDWSKGTNVISGLDSRGIAHTGVAYKVIASETDPREIYRKPSLQVFTARHHMFRNYETFCYPERGDIKGPQLEGYLQSIGLASLGQKSLRSLFRFSHTLGVDKEAMKYRLPDGQLFLDNPLQAVDGIEKALNAPKENKEEHIHLDIYRGVVLTKLENYFRKYNADLADPAKVLSAGELRAAARVNRELAGKER